MDQFITELSLLTEDTWGRAVRRLEQHPDARALSAFGQQWGGQGGREGVGDKAGARL